MSLHQQFITFVLLALTLTTHAAQIVIVNSDGADEGFNDTTPVTAIGGNTATTLGQQRLNVFQQAADIIETFLEVNVNINVEAKFDPLPCSSSSAVLGSAGTLQVWRDFPSAPHSSTWYHSALTNELYGSDAGIAAAKDSAEIAATFNSEIDNNNNCLNGIDWYYGFDDPSLAGAEYTNDSSLLSVVIHEILHGLGVSSMVDSAGNLNEGYIDAYSRHLHDVSTNKSWITMSASERSASSVNSTNLVWNGSNVNNSAAALSLTNGINNGKVEMYAPNPYEGGSSVSHFSKDATPNEIMEPSYTEFLTTIGMAAELLQDMGWTLNNANSAPIFTSKDDLNTLYSNPLVHALSATDANADSLIFALTSYDSTHISASLTGTELTLQSKNNFIGNTAITVTVSDGTNITAQTINLTINENFALASSEGNLTNNSTLVIPNNAFEFTLAGGNRNYSVEVLFDGKDQTNHLLSTSGEKYYLAMPESGAFAGNYTIAITDSNGETADFIIQRPLKLSANTHQLTSSSIDQQLYIEGAPAGTVLDLYINEGNQVLDLQVNNTNINQVIAPDDAANFNRAQVSLNVNDSTTLQTMNVSADTATLPEGDITLTTLPFHPVQITVKDSSGSALLATTQINDNRFIIWGLNQIQPTDELGKVILSVPQEPSINLTISAADHQSKTIEVDPLVKQLSITLERLNTPAINSRALNDKETPTTDSNNHDTVVKTSTSSGGSGYLVIISLLLLINVRKRWALKMAR